MPTLVVQHGVTGVVAVFHWQTAGSVQPALDQESGPGLPRPRDTEAQLRGVTGPRREQASFTVINKGDVGRAGAEQGVRIGLRSAGYQGICGDGAAGDFNRSLLK